MPNQSRFTGLAASLLALAVAATAPAAAQAQAAPQLLPYTVTAVAGGGTAAIAAGATCPVSGYTSTDAFGDGCLATEVQLGVPRFVTTNATGVIYFSDTNNGLIRRIDPITGIITAVVGGAASSPASGATCGVGVSTDAHGDGCPASLVKIGKPEGLIFAPNGDLYFADNSFDDVRKVAAIGGAITPNSIITNVVGNISTFGYNVNNTSTTGPVNAATQGYLNFPYGLALDAAGNLYIADEGNQAIEVINTGATTRTIQGLSVPAGTIAKIIGTGDLANKKQTGLDCPSFVSTTARGGCYFGSWTDGNPAVASPTDNPYDVAVDAAGNVYFPNEFNYNVGRISASNIITNYAGIQGTKGTTLKRGTAGTFGIGNTFNVALDPAADLYISDGTNGVVWRVDAGTLSMYPLLGGATTTCSAATDAFGNGCPGLQAILGKSSGSGATLLPGTGGLFVDPFGSLLFTDTSSNTIRMASSGTQFGAVGANQPTQIADIHFAAGDSPAANAYTLTAGTGNFVLGSATCTANSDNTTDCLLPITATPSTLGAFSGTLTVKSTLGKTSTFPLNGNYVNSPLTRTALAFVTGATCLNSNPSQLFTVGTNSPVTLTATVFSTGSPTGNVTFFANGTQIGTPQPVKNGAATLTYTFATVGTYALTASYGGDTFFKVSTGKAGNTITSANPSFATALVPNAENTVTAGGTALYSFTVTQTAFTGTITFACSGLPSGAACVFNPPSITNSGCSETDTVALSITTTQPGPVKQTSLAMPLRGNWQALGILPGIALAFFVALRRRRSAARLGSLCLALALLLATSGLVACGKVTSTPGTPTGTSTITITATGSTGGTQTLTVPLTVK